MAVKIKRVEIKNFKVFEDFQADFKESNLIVFDGPNGFGKTSFFDALELLLTGKIRRYEDLVDSVIYGRKEGECHPFLNDRRLNDQIEEDGYLIIKAEMEINGKAVCLMRCKAVKELKKTLHLKDGYRLPLYILDEFDTSDGKFVEAEAELLKKYLGDNYIKNFEFLNYIEQQENIYLLKKNDKQRQGAIDHLFNTAAFQSQIEKLNEASQVFSKLCNPKAAKELEKLKTELEKNQLGSSDKKTQVPYKKCFAWKHIEWDAEELEFPGERYVEWLGKEGELSKLKCFLENIDDFQNNMKNTKLDVLLKNQDATTQLLRYWNFLDRLDDYDAQLRERQNISEFLKMFEKGISSAIEKDRADLSKELCEVLKSDFDVKAYSNEIAKIKSLKKNASILNNLLVDLKETRKLFIEKFTRYERETEPKETCPLCGYLWKNAEKLKESLSNQAEHLEELIHESGKELNMALMAFDEIYLVPIKKFLNQVLSKEAIDEVFVKGVREAVASKTVLEDLYNMFEKIGVDLKPFLNSKPEITEVELHALHTLVESKRVECESDNIQGYFADVFCIYFKESLDNVLSIKKDDLENKRRYIEWQYSMYQSLTLKKMQLRYTELEVNFLKAKMLKGKIKQTIDIYQESIANYNKTITKGIEILFHIYSGRIMQETQGSLGLFIAADGKKIRFLESHNKKHDAVFTMSSGQLSALIIAFTLALNKRYSQEELLFIDDPMQTLDELNFAGFVELLRNDFNDRQIFISTHEDVMSAYMRYKFKKFDLHAERINFKEKLLSVK